MKEPGLGDVSSCRVIIVRRTRERLLRRSFISHRAAGPDCTDNKLFPVITTSSNSSPTRADLILCRRNLDIKPAFAFSIKTLNDITRSRDYDWE